MKNFIKTLMVIGGITYAAGVLAADAKIGIVDSQKIMEQSLAAKSIRDQVTKKADTARTAATKKEEKLRQSFQELEGKKKRLSDDAFKAENAQLMKEAEELNKSFYTERMALEKSANDAMAKIEAELVSIVDKKAKEKGLNLVFIKAMAVYNDPSLDITDEVLSVLNKNLSDVKIVVSTSDSSKK